MNNIAIVIPAYKDRFLEDTLNSLIKQNMSDCIIYLFDDNSPYNIQNIYEQYKEQLPIIYHRFEENMGGRSLSEHWNRCIDFIEPVKWVWLFSDDDIMCDGCFENVAKAICEYNSEYDVFHINGDVVNNDLEHLNWSNIGYFPIFLSPADYIRTIFSGKDNTWGINFIVRYEVMKAKGGFVNFDLAWNADRASWLNFSYPKGIRTIENAKVLWRYSGENISSLRKDIEVQKRKAYARIEFLSWINDFIVRNRIGRIRVGWINKFKYVLKCFRSNLNIGFMEDIVILLRSIKQVLAI